MRSREHRTPRVFGGFKNLYLTPIWHPLLTGPVLYSLFVEICCANIFSKALVPLYAIVQFLHNLTAYLLQFCLRCEKGWQATRGWLSVFLYGVRSEIVIVTALNDFLLKYVPVELYMAAFAHFAALKTRLPRLVFVALISRPLWNGIEKCCPAWRGALTCQMRM